MKLFLQLLHPLLQLFFLFLCLFTQLFLAMQLFSLHLSQTFIIHMLCPNKCNAITFLVISFVTQCSKVKLLECKQKHL